MAMIESMFALSGIVMVASATLAGEQNEIETLRAKVQEALQAGDFDLAVSLVEPLKGSDDPDLRLAVADVYLMRADFGVRSTAEKACDTARALVIALEEARKGSQVAASMLAAAYGFGRLGLPKDEAAAACWNRLTRPGANAECPAPQVEQSYDDACGG
jgi:hypothetical protein